MSAVFIGMPVYNGARFLPAALDSLVGQSFRDWRLLLSDNGSIDETGAIARVFAARDDRIRYVQHPINRGPYFNFKYVMDQADSPYFMWAAADDVWEPQFLEACVDHLDDNPHIGLAFTGVDAIDSFGRVIRGCPTLPSLTGSASFRTVYRYLIDPEINGKANLIYGLYRLEICKAAWVASKLADSKAWGSDMCFVLAALSRRGAIVDERVLFHKRYVRADDTPEKVNRIELAKHRRLGFPRREFAGYLRGNLAAVRGTRFYWLTLAVLLFRMFNPVQSRGF